MKKESGFSSKKVSELKNRRRKKTEKVIQPEKNNDVFENQEIKKDLQSFYDKEAKKYAETRKKFWHEEKAILDAITPLFEDCHFDQREKSIGVTHSGFFANAQNDGDTQDSQHSGVNFANASEGQYASLIKGGGEGNLPSSAGGKPEGFCPPLGKEGNHEVVEDSYSGNVKIPSTKAVSPLSKGEQDNPPYPPCQRGAGKKLRILEFGCGSGRFATLLNQSFPNKFDYVGIDLSDELLSYASTQNPNLTFFQGDITKLIKNFEQESFDLIVGTSSFQHIPTNKERSFLMKNFYRLLSYDGTLLMTNWSLSKWFVKKHLKAVLKARFKALIQFDKSKSRDIMVPWMDTANGKIYDRYYHFFSLKELDKLTTFSGLSTKLNVFIDQDANFTYNEKISRSSFLIAKKTPIIN